MIALVATDITKEGRLNNTSFGDDSQEKSSERTLIVVPPACQYCSSFDYKTKKAMLTTLSELKCLEHGKSNLLSMIRTTITPAPSCRGDLASNT